MTWPGTAAGPQEAVAAGAGQLQEASGGSALAAAHPGGAAGTKGRRPTAGPWTRFLLRRTGRLLASLACLVVASFALIHFVPGDPVRAALGVTAPVELVESRRRLLGLDRPILEQFWSYLSGLLHGDLGTSLTSSLPVSKVIGDRFVSTAVLAGLAFAVVMVVALPLGMLLGILTRDGRRRRLELAFVALANTLTGIPSFLLAVGAVTLFSVGLSLLPVAGRSGPGSWVLPVFTLAAGPAATLALIVRVETLRVLSQDYMRTARAKRLPTRLLYLRHALPNMLTAALTLGGLLLGGLVAGTVLVENVFAWPGLGTTIVGSINSKDYPLVQGVVLVLGGAVLVINLVVDLLVAVFDPRSTVLET